MTRTYNWLDSVANDWSGTEGGRWIFVAKTLLAAFVALWLAFRFDLDSPTTALSTVFILAQPSSGMVLEKSFHRLLGTLVGCASALILIAMFPQQPVLLFLGLALWVGLCTSGAAMFRNAQSYSFVLAGYTTCMIAIPSIDHPTQVFALAVTRMAEVGLGVICSAVINDALFPRHQGTEVMRTVQARYTGFVSFCHEVLEQKLAPAEVELMHLRFAADIAALESGRAAAYFEAGHARADSRQLHAFNASFMTTLTTFYTLHRLLHRLHQSAVSPVLTLIEPLYAMLADALKIAPQQSRLDEVSAQLQVKVVNARQTLNDRSPGLPQQIDFDTAAELLERFALNMRDFQALYFGLAQKKRQLLSDPLTYTPKTPRTIVAASGLRAAAALALLAITWYYLAWPYAAVTLLMTTIFCSMAASSPRPALLMRQILTGFLIASPLSFFCIFFILVRVSGYPMLVLCTLPVVALGLYIMTNPKRAGIGLGIIMFTAQVVAPANLMRVDGADFLNYSLALIIGVFLAYVIFGVVLPEHTMGHKDHVARALWREALKICVAAPRRLKHRFDSRVHDLLSQLNAAAGPMPSDATRAVVRQALTLLELGHSVIEIRALIAASAPSAVRSALLHGVKEIAAYLLSPTPDACRNAVAAVLRAGPPVRQAQLESGPQDGIRLQTALTDLHSIYTSLLDQAAVTPGEANRAA